MTTINQKADNPFGKLKFKRIRGKREEKAKRKQKKKRVFDKGYFKSVKVYSFSVLLRRKKSLGYQFQAAESGSWI